MTDLSPRQLASFVRSIAILALDAEHQVAWLRSLGLGEPGYVDELAEEFEAGALLSAQHRDLGWINPDALSPILELDQLLGSLSGPQNEEFWTVEALSTDSRWHEVRSRAVHLLCLLH